MTEICTPKNMLINMISDKHILSFPTPHGFVMNLTCTALLKYFEFKGKELHLPIRIVTYQFSDASCALPSTGMESV